MKAIRQLHNQAGFAIISAIVLVVVLAALGVAITTISTTEQVGSAMDVQGFRAYQAARSGIEWGAYQVWSSNPSTRNSASCPTGSTATPYVSFTPTAPTLSTFTVTVQCTATTDPSGFGGPTVFKIVSTACNMPNGGACPGANASIGSLNYVERKITVTL